jgi:transposase
MALKRQMVEETLSGDISVSVVARRYDVNANQLFKWRRQYHQGMLGDASAPALIPITLNTDYPVNKVSAAAHEKSANQNCIEITFLQGERVVICGSVCQDTLGTVLQALSS